MRGRCALHIAAVRRAEEISKKAQASHEAAKAANMKAKAASSEAAEAAQRDTAAATYAQTKLNKIMLCSFASLLVN